MRLDKDYLTEMELWPHFEMRLKRTADTLPASQNPARQIEPASHDLPPEAYGNDYANDVMPHEDTTTDTPSRRPIVQAKSNATTVTRTVVGAKASETKSTSANIAAPVIDPARAARISTLSWEALAADVSSCNTCGLCKQRKQAVFGVGAQDAPWLFVGEGPGADEDAQGEPFVGQAGKLLDAILSASGLQRGREVYIANVVKCRPPGNRTPTLDEAAACAPYLDRQIDLVKPKIIVALGKTAVMRLTGSEASMASLRGQVFQYRDTPVVATYHPAYLLRNLPEKLKVWEDLQFAKSVLLAKTITAQ
jgi:uracil-DNA glycosylase